MYSHSLRAAAASSSTFALGRFGGARVSGGGGGAVVSAPGIAASPCRGGRGVSATPAASAPLPGEQGVGMEQPKQQQPRVPRKDASREEEEKDDGAGEVKQYDAHGDVMTHSFGEGYSTRSDEEGFGGVYGGNDPVENPGTEDIHPSHPDYDKSQGSEVKDKEKARNVKDDKNAT